MKKFKINLKQSSQSFTTNFKSRQENFSLKLQDYISVSTEQYESYGGEYVVTPQAYDNQTLETKNKIMKDDITVLKVPFFSVDNASGQTVSIALEV